MANNEQKEYLTKEKYKEFEKELNELRRVKRKEVAENLEYAKSLGDLSENAEYHEARDMQAQIENRISKLKTLLQSAEIVSEKRDTEEVSVGSEVVFSKEGEKEKRTYTIVGSEEADTESGKISVNSPVGRGFMGKKKGDRAKIEAPKGEVVYVIEDIK